MTTLVLSQCSSNPLQVASSDPRNTTYIQTYLQSQKHQQDESLSSEAVLAHHNRAEVESYQHHIADVLARRQARQTTTENNTVRKRPPLMVDLGEERDDDDELNLGHRPEFEEDAEDGVSEDEDPDAQGETDEETTIYLKPKKERREIQREIESLEKAVPQLIEDYKLVDRLGTGTFSSVYKAIDLGYHEKWDNNPWHGFHPSSSSAYYQSAPHPRDSKVFVAIKRIYVTSNPERIRNEISIMLDGRGCRHSSQLITAFRHLDQVVLVMPYQRNEDFREFYRSLPMAGIKAYFRCMFRALRDIHSRGIIHRDVKPANFLFDPRTGMGTLCDFGLACRMDSSDPNVGRCLHGPPSREHPHGKLRDRTEYDIEQFKRAQREARQKSVLPSDKVGYPDKDTRPYSRANRSGTRGFRAPEVLLKCNQQTGAIDVWAAGMILLFFLVGKFPLFQSSDDVEALVEIAAIVGRSKMERVATMHSRTFATNVPSIPQEGISWREFVEQQNPKIMEPRKPDMHYFPYYGNACTHTKSHSQSELDTLATQLPPSSSSSFSSRGPLEDNVDIHPRRSRSSSSSHGNNYPEPPSAESHRADVEAAFSLLAGLMNPESVRRLTPRAALYHPFLADSSEPEDDEFYPHPFGDGVCGEWHFLDDVTEEPCVLIDVGASGVRKERVRRLAPGQGIAIGSQPCEFHRNNFQ